MTKILAIDTAASSCSAALLDSNAGAREINEKYSDQPRAHTRLILPMVDELLAEADVRVADLDALAFSAGPGSFTGLRISAGVVQGLAYACELPVIRVSTLQSMASTAFRNGQVSEGQIVIPSFDARMEEVYWAVYRAAETPEQLIAPQVTAPKNLVAAIPEESGVGVGDGWQLVGDVAESFIRYIDFAPRAHDVAILAEQALRRGDTVSADAAQPIYIRNTVSWKKRHEQ